MAASVDKQALTVGSGTDPLAYSFDAFGKRRNTNWTPDNSDALQTADSWNHRGYTDHEQLDNVRLIHMGGRVYDPKLGRFISADPVLGDLGDPQSLNPYSYVMNNPLRFTDPSGFTPCVGDPNCMTVIGRIGGIIGNRGVSETVGQMLDINLVRLESAWNELARREIQKAQGYRPTQPQAASPPAPAPKTPEDGSEEEEEEKENEEDENELKTCGKSVTAAYSVDMQAGLGLLGGIISVDLGGDATNGRFFMTVLAGAGVGIGGGFAASPGGLSGGVGKLTSWVSSDTGTIVFGGYVNGAGPTGSYQVSDSGGFSGSVPTTGAGRGAIGAYAGGFVGSYGSATIATPPVFCNE